MSSSPTVPAATAAVEAPALAEPVEVCPNCRTERAGEYCHGCGQHFLQRRLTLKIMWREFAERFLKLERGLLRTVSEMTTDPGGVVQRYVDGQRRRYLNPFSYLVVGSLLSVLVYQLTGMHEELITVVQDSVYQNPSSGSGMAPPVFMQQYSDFLKGLMGYSLYISLAMGIPFAMLLRLLFYRSRYNLAETVVFVLYCFGHVGIVWAPLSLLRWAFDIPIGAMAFSYLGMLFYIVLCSVAAFTFFQEKLSAVLKITVSYAASYLVVIAIIIGGFIGYLILNPLRTAGGEDGWTLLEAAEENALLIARQLLEEGTDVNQTTGETPLHVAVLEGHAGMVTLLLEHGADVNARDYLGRVPMIIALHLEEHDLAEQLAHAGTDPNAARIDGTTLLMETIEHGHPALTRYLLEAGADVNAVRDAHEATALMEAAGAGDLESVELLLAHGADATLTNPDGQTALDMAADDAVAASLRAALEQGGHRSLIDGPAP